MPLFVTFEGGEGAGKSTQAAALAARMNRAGRPAFLTREPGGTPTGVKLRQILLDSQLDDLPPRAEALLFAADRAIHVEKIIRPALYRGKTVISDRYADSSIAYQAAGRNLDPEDVDWLSAWATCDMQPDLVFVLDIDPLLGLWRSGRRSAPDRMEKEDLRFHERARATFLRLADRDRAGRAGRNSRFPQRRWPRYVVLDATESADVLASTIADAVDATMLAKARTGNVHGLAETRSPVE